MEASVQLDYRGRPRSEHQTVNDEPSMTVQSDKEKADIHYILGRYSALGMAASLNTAEGRYLDVSELNDFADVMRVAKEAEVEFMKLPAKVRRIFDNDVANWLDTAHDDDKRQALVEAGYLPAEVPEPAVEPVPDPPSGASE